MGRGRHTYLESLDIHTINHFGILVSADVHREPLPPILSRRLKGIDRVEVEEGRSGEGPSHL